MLLGKRPRPPIRRTTSMTDITVDLSNVETEESSDMNDMLSQESPAIPKENMNYLMREKLVNIQQHHQHYFSPRNNHSDFIETAHFLRTCGFCKRRLASGRDIYMYRGDAAFCSLECREKQMKKDERKEKFMASAEEHHTSPSSNSKASSRKRQTVIAA